MKKIAIVACGTHRASGLSCPDEWRCLQAAALGEGKFDGASQVVTLISCECPGQNIIPELIELIASSGTVLEAIHISTCLSHTRPGCPYRRPEELARLIERATAVPVILGSHQYPADRLRRPTDRAKVKLIKIFR